MTFLVRTRQLATVGFVLACVRVSSAQVPSADLQKHLQAAQADSDAGRYSAEVDELRAAIAINPQIRGAYYQLGFAMLQLHNPFEAEKAFTKELEFQPPDPYSLYYLGVIRSEAGQRRAAVSLFEKSLNAGEVLDVREKLGSNYLALGQLEEALRFLETSVGLRPEDGGLRYLLGRAWKQKGKTDEAKVEFEAAARWKAKFRSEMVSLEGLRQALKTNNQADVAMRTHELSGSNDSDILLASATILGQAGLHEQAGLFLKRTININPTIPEAYYDLGRANIALGKRDEAIPELKKATELKPDFYEAQLLLGTLLADNGDGEEAIKRLRAAAQVRADNPRLLLMLGLQYYRLNYFADAIGILKKAVTLAPDNPDPRYLLIESYYRNFEYEHALSFAQETLALFPNKGLSHYHVAAQLNNLGRFSEAKQQLDLALVKDPELIEAQAMLGDVLFKMGKAEDSVVCFRRVLERDPGMIDAQTGLGKALIQLKKYSEAASAMEEATKIDPKPAALHLYLSQAYRALGRGDDAKKEAAVFSRLNQERANARDRDVDRKYPN